MGFLLNTRLEGISQQDSPDPKNPGQAPFLKAVAQKRNGVRHLFENNVNCLEITALSSL